MAMERELSEMLGYYLDREYDLDALQGALAELTWSNLEAPRAAHRIEFLIGEAIDGRLGGDELRTELDQVRKSLLLAQAKSERLLSRRLDVGLAVHALARFGGRCGHQ